MSENYYCCMQIKEMVGSSRVEDKEERRALLQGSGCPAAHGMPCLLWQGVLEYLPLDPVSSKTLLRSVLGRACWAFDNNVKCPGCSCFGFRLSGLGQMQPNHDGVS